MKHLRIVGMDGSGEPPISFADQLLSAVRAIIAENPVAVALVYETPREIVAHSVPMSRSFVRGLLEEALDGMNADEG